MSKYQAIIGTEAEGAKVKNYAPTPVNPTDVANKAYVDAAAQSVTSLRSDVVRVMNTGITITIRNDNWTTYTNLGGWSQPSGAADLTTANCLSSWDTTDVFTTPYQCEIKKFKCSFYSPSSGNVVRWAIGTRDFTSGSFDASVLNPSLIWTSTDQTTTGGTIYYKEFDLSGIVIPINKQVILMGFDANGQAAAAVNLQRTNFQFHIEEVV